MTPSDIKFYHSGGGSNCDPLSDLGGAISSCELIAGLDTLFDDLTGKESRAGLLDYCCFYVKNTSSSEILRNAVFYIDWERKSGSFIDVGVSVIDAVQTVEVSGTTPPNENDSMTLSVTGYGDFEVVYSTNVVEWQGRFQTAIRGLDGLQDVLVDVAGSIGFPTDVVFTVRFLGQAGSRQVSPIIVVSNDLTGQTINVVQTQDGGPVNTTTCTISDVTEAPSCVEFNLFLRGNPVEVGDLLPNDSFPVWVRRTTPANTRLRLRDKVRFNVDGTFP